MHYFYGHIRYLFIIINHSEYNLDHVCKERRYGIIEYLYNSR